MNTAEYVKQLSIDLRNNGVPLSDAVWQTACACEGQPYVYAAWKFQNCTPGNRKSRNGGSTTPSEDHPTIVTACQVLSGKTSSCDGCKWFPNGGRVWMYDCRGFTHDMLALFGIELYGAGCTTQWNHKDNWKAKGTIDTIPDDILVCLFQQDGSKMSHTGFGFKGKTAECQKGVQIKSKREKKWTHWAIPKGIDGDMPDYRPTLRKGDKGEYVTLAQTELIQHGYSVGDSGADGIFGSATEKAVKRFQQDNVGQDGKPLKVDGIIGSQTWWALDQTDITLYTVTIPHLPKYHADALVANYSGAYMTEERG